MLELVCGPAVDGARWKGPTALQLSSEFEASRFKGLGNEGMRQLVTNTFPTLQALVALDLGYNSIGPPGASAFAAGLCSNAAICSSLKALSLRINLLGDSGIKHLAA